MLFGIFLTNRLEEHNPSVGGPRAATEDFCQPEPPGFASVPGEQDVSLAGPLLARGSAADTVLEAQIRKFRAFGVGTESSQALHSGPGQRLALATK